jgi:hypothetical protein
LFAGTVVAVGVLASDLDLLITAVNCYRFSLAPTPCNCKNTVITSPQQEIDAIVI